MSVWLFTEEHRHLYDTDDVYAFMLPLLKREQKQAKRSEFIWVLSFNEHMVLLALELLKLRNFDDQVTKFRPADFFSIPLTVKATCIMIVQAHDDGTISPRKEDVIATEKIMRVGKEVSEIPLLDHILISGEGFTSLADDDSIFKA